jgi:hypothetical protein
MAKSKMRRKRTARSVLKLPDLEKSKSAVLNSLTSASSQRTYDDAIREFIERYCSEPRQDCGHPIPDFPRITALCINHDQPATRRSSEVGLRGCRLRSPQCRSGGWDSPGKGCKAIEDTCWQLAYRGTR